MMLRHPVRVTGLMLATSMAALLCNSHASAQVAEATTPAINPNPKLAPPPPANVSQVDTQGASPPASAGSDNLAQSGDIVVTARKESESLSRVGLSITAATGAQLAERGITTVAALTRLEPSLQYAKSFDNTPIFTIRGVGYNDNSIEAAPTVSVYEDEVPYAYPVMTKGALLDIQRVEVLKGPQGTLYGQNATGGAINFIANKPTDILSAGLNASYGNFNAAHFDGFVSGPITDKLSVRVSAATDQGGAWQRSYTRDDTLGNRDDYQVRALLEWKPTSNFTANLNLNGWQDKSDTQAKQLLSFYVKSPQYVGLGAGNNEPTRAQIATMPAYASLLQQILAEPVAPHNDRAADWPVGTHPHANEHFYQGTLRLDWTVNDAFGLTSLTSFEHYREHDQIDVAGNQLPADSRVEFGVVNSLFQELRAHGTLGFDGISWQIGVNYIHDKSNQTTDEFTTQSGSYLSGFPPSVGKNPPFQDLFLYANNTTETKSVFGNVSVPIIPTLKLNAGVRYSDVNSTFGGCVGTTDPQLVALISGAFGDGSARVGQQCVTVLTKGGPSGYYVTPLHEHNVPWRVGLEWQATGSTLLYALVSKGYKAGASPILTATVANQLKPVTQESLLDYEAGFKTSLFGGRLKINADGFYYDYRDKQLFGRTIDPIFGALQSLLNIPKTHEVGAEGSIVWRPVSGLTLDAAVTYLDSHVDTDFVNVDAYGHTANYQGEHFPFTPKWSTVGGVRYERAVKAGLVAFVSARASYQTSTTAAFGADVSAAAGAPSVRIDPYALLDLSAGIGPANGRWRLEVWGRNVTNTYYWTNVNYNGDIVTRLTGMPATYGFTVGFKY